jgi:hypothetical protein
MLELIRLRRAAVIFTICLVRDIALFERGCLATGAIATQGLTAECPIVGVVDKFDRRNVLYQRNKLGRQGMLGRRVSIRLLLRRGLLDQRGRPRGETGELVPRIPRRLRHQVRQEFI